MSVSILTRNVRDRAFAELDAERCTSPKFQAEPKHRDRTPDTRMRHLSDRPARHLGGNAR